MTPVRDPARMAFEAIVACAPAALAAALLGACSLVVQFHDQSLPAGADGGCTGAGCDDASVPPDVGPTPEAAAPDGDAGSPPPEAAPPPDHVAPCHGLANGYYCANDGPAAYPGPPSDLLTCNDGGVKAALPCDGGCLHIPDPFPDACNPCPGVKNGLYCGRDLAGFPSYNADFLLQCQNGDAVQVVACAHGCGSSGTTSSCFP